MDIWAEYEATDESTDEEMEKTEEESEIIDEISVSASYITEFEATETKESTTKAEEERQQLHLIGVEKKTNGDASQETLITLEDEVIESDKVSIESSVHPCLREIDISDSQLKLVNPYTVYPIPNDPGLIPAFWLLHERPPIYKDEGAQQFYDTVKRSHLRPIRMLKNMFVSDEINLRYYELEPGVIKAISKALENNTIVRKMDLKDSRLSPNECKYLKELLLKNSTITNLSFSGCRIDANGIKQLCDALSRNMILKTLDLSDCNIRSEGFEHVATALSKNQSVESINLSNNYLDESCAEDLQSLLSYSGTLTHLDLSWNSLYSAKTWKALINGLKKNNTLVSLILSWNSLGEECLPYLYQLLSRSQSIEKLDLNWNRFTKEDAVPIAKALAKNNTLQELYLGNNPLKPQGALALVRAITPQVSPDNVLRFLDLENVWANKEIIQELEIIKNLKPWIIIKLGGILSNYALVGPNSGRILFDRANYEATKPKQKRLRRNFGDFVMSLEEKIISQTKFLGLVKKFKLKLSTSLLNEIMNIFKGPKKNTVDQGQLKSFYIKEYAITPTLLELQKTETNKYKVETGSNTKGEI